MKPIIIDMNDMSDSAEVYESRPNPIIVYFIYLVLAIIVTALIWMAVSDIDIVVKGNATFRGEAEAYEVSSAVTGKLIESFVADGQYVEAGDSLYSIDIVSLSETIINYQKELSEVEDRIKILEAYRLYLDGDESALDIMQNNIYYSEIINRKNLLLANKDSNDTTSADKIDLYRANVESIEQSINQYNQKIEKLNMTKQCISSRNNTFDSQDVYYYNLINSYISKYSYNEKQYDDMINTYSESGDDEKVQILQEEKKQALNNIELEQLSAIEQQIENYNSAISTLHINLTNAKLQLVASQESNAELGKNIVVLTEKNNIDAQIENCNEKKSEYEKFIRTYDIQNDNCTIKANSSGYYYKEQQMSYGAYIKEGSCIGKIYPKQQTGFYTLAYVENSEIGRVKLGQKVKLEIAAYPISEYGYFEGKITDVSKDIIVDSSTGRSYYQVKIENVEQVYKNKKTKSVSLMNGMACQAKIVTGKKKILTYLLEKIDLID